VLASVHVLSAGAARALGLEGHDAFRATLEAEIERARYFARGVAVVFVSGPREVHVRRWLPRLREALRPVDRVALYSPDAVEILLPEVSAEQAQEVAATLAERRSEDPELRCGVALFPGAATSADKLIEASRDAARRTTASEPVRSAPVEGPRTIAAAGAADGGLSTQSPIMTTVIETARRLAKSTIPVLLFGETGSGKEVVARLIHASGPRRERPMICVNCGAIASQLLESALFGHERGAFTGAVQQHRGVFEAADGGTVLLDEVGELPAAAQVALLRVLETKRVTRVGSTRETEVDVRVIAATHRDLEAMCEAGTFRTDLLYRLNAMTVRIPSLRERREDIAALAKQFLRDAAEANDSHVRSIEPEALALLEGYTWPGNVRELKNAIERAVVIAEGGAVAARDLPERVRAAAASSDEPPRRAPAASATSEDSSSTAASAELGFKGRVEEFEGKLIVEALRACSWNQTEAARWLKLPLRTLQHKIKALGIKRLGYGTVDGR
jgi:DNA-binding NtrC family response regulator